jgi:hypothetical protein
MAVIIRFIVAGLAAGLFWAAWQFFTGAVPKFNSVSLLSECWAWEQWDLILPIGINRWWDILFLPICAEMMFRLNFRCIWHWFGITIGLLGFAAANGVLYIIVFQALMVIVFSVGNRNLFNGVLKGAFASILFSTGITLGMAPGFVVACAFATVTAALFVVLLVGSELVFFLADTMAKIPATLISLRGIAWRRVAEEWRTATLQALRGLRIF